jgi:hypothetical protein
MGCKCEARGLEKLDLKQHYVLASNHESLTDTALIYSMLPKRHLISVSKKELSYIPVFGWLMRLVSPSLQIASIEFNLLQLPGSSFPQVHVSCAADLLSLWPPCCTGGAHPGRPEKSRQGNALNVEVTSPPLPCQGSSSPLSLITLAMRLAEIAVPLIL